MNSLMNTYSPFPIELVDGHDFHLIDKQGKKYIDLTSGIGVCNLGYSNQPISDAVNQQLKKVWHLSNLYENSLANKVAEKLNPTDFKAFFCNSGTEANEAALKLAHKATGRKKVIAFDNGFHGRTIGSLSVTGYPKIKNGFGPLITDIKMLKYNDFSSIDKIDKDTAAVILEVIQGEGGINVGSKEWMLKLQEKCHSEGTLLIIDEVQTGIGRTGYKFAYEAFDLNPDIITTAKGLGNGLPVGAMLAKSTVANHFHPGDHGNTFGGNPIVMKSAFQVLKQLNPVFLKNVREKGEFFSTILKEKTSSLSKVLSISGLGLMLGIKLHPSIPVNEVIKQLQKDGFLTLSSRNNTLRLLPPLIIDKVSLNQSAEAIINAITKLT